MSGEWGESKVGSWDSPSSKEPQLLEMSADLLSVYECEDKDSGEGCGDGNGYAYTDQLEIGQVGVHRWV